MVAGEGLQHRAKLMHLSLCKCAWSARTDSVPESVDAGLLKPTHPSLHTPRIVIEPPSHRKPTMPLADEHHAMKAMLKSGLRGALMDVFQSKASQLRIYRTKLTHSRPPPSARRVLPATSMRHVFCPTLAMAYVARPLLRVYACALRRR